MFLWFGHGWSDGRFPIVSVAMASVVSYAGGAMGVARIGAMAAAGGMASAGGMAGVMLLLSAAV
jgi:hypothetical protein